jgi:hypothetical protein
MAQVSGRRFVFHPRPLWWSQAMEIGKWIVKRVGGRKDAPFPSYRDIDSRALAPSFECETARELLGWQPLEERNAVLQALREAWAPSSPEPPEPSGLSGEQVRDATLARRG